MQRPESTPQSLPTYLTSENSYTNPQHSLYHVSQNKNAEKSKILLWKFNFTSYMKIKSNSSHHTIQKQKCINWDLVLTSIRSLEIGNTTISSNISKGTKSQNIRVLYSDQRTQQLGEPNLSVFRNNREISSKSLIYNVLEKGKKIGVSTSHVLRITSMHG